MDLIRTFYLLILKVFIKYKSTKKVLKFKKRRISASFVLFFSFLLFSQDYYTTCFIFYQ
nr:MAG TPA: hypothetical protein [Caudoviricetes sp.]